MFSESAEMAIYIFLPSGRPEADFLEEQLKLCSLRKDLPARNHLRTNERRFKMKSYKNHTEHYEITDTNTDTESYDTPFQVDLIETLNVIAGALAAIADRLEAQDATPL